MTVGGDEMYTDVIFPNMTNTLHITGCHFGAKPPGWRYPRHHHHLYEIMYCQAGTARLKLQHLEIRLRPGDWLFIRSGTRHEMENMAESEDCFRFFDIHFDMDDYSIRKTLSQREYHLLPASMAEMAGLTEYVAHIEREMQPSLASAGEMPAAETERRLTLNPVQKIALQAYILLIIQEILRLAMKVEEESMAAEPLHSTIHKADTAHLIEEKLQHLISGDGSISQAADELNLSRSQFTKVFKEIYGISPRQYLTETKLNRAKQMLVSTSKTVEDIADELGYHSVSHFSRQFRRGTGLSPNQFRPRPRA